MIAALPWPWVTRSRAVASLGAARRTLHVLGDSHVTMFRGIAGLRGLRRTRVHLHVVGGATATGLPNPNSKTQAGPIFQQTLREIPAEHDVLLCLGEVDCGFAIWYRAQKHELSVEQQLDLAIRNYAELIDAARQGRQGQVILCTAPLPTIRDGEAVGEVANKRREIRATLRDRTDLTQTFNRRLADIAAQRGLAMLDLTAATLDPATGLIDDRFRHPNPRDHHLGPRQIRPVLVRALRELGFA